MDEPSKASQSAGSGPSHQRPVTHSRPFFYVQPPLQPFYTYPWHMNNPYSHSAHGSGFHFGRPYMVPYSYLQCPGYVIPHAAVHPVDCRRIYERSIPLGTSAATYDFSFQQHQPQPQPSGAQKEMTCSGAQTEPCEALNKLIECLDQLRAGDNQIDRTLLPLDEEVKSLEKTEGCTRKCLSESKTAEPDITECSGDKCFTQEEDWSVSLETGPSLDNSSAQEEGNEIKEEEDFCAQSQNSLKDTEVLSGSREKNQDEKVPDLKSCELGERMELEDSNANWPPSQSSPVHPTSAKMTKSQGTGSADYSCGILHLPFEKVLNDCVFGPGSSTRSLGSPFGYGYYPPQLSHERVSVLSPSLDELSSHDELLSTDLEDMGPYTTRIYTRDRLAEVASRKSNQSPGDIHADMCVFYPKRLTCSVCGSHAFKKHSRPKAFHCERHCYVDDSDEEANTGGWETMNICKHCVRGTMMKIHASKKTHQLSKQRLKHREELDRKPGHAEASCADHICCEKIINTPEKRFGHSARGINTRLCKERMNQRKSRLKPERSRNDSATGGGGDYGDGEEDVSEEDVQEMLLFHREKGTKKRGGMSC